jgi:hypothetical protein
MQLDLTGYKTASAIQALDHAHWNTVAEALGNNSSDGSGTPLLEG